MFCHMISYSIILVISYDKMFYHIRSQFIIAYEIISCYFKSHILYHIMLNHIISGLIISYHIVNYHFMLCYIISYQYGIIFNQNILCYYDIGYSNIWVSYHISLTWIEATDLLFGRPLPATWIPWIKAI